MVSSRASVSHATLTRLKDFSCPGSSESRASDQVRKMEVEPSVSAPQQHSVMNSYNELEEEVKEEPNKIKQVWFYTKLVCFRVDHWKTVVCLNCRLHVYEILDLSLKGKLISFSVLARMAIIAADVFTFSVFRSFPLVSLLRILWSKRVQKSLVFPTGEPRPYTLLWRNSTWRSKNNMRTQCFVLSVATSTGSSVRMQR